MYYYSMCTLTVLRDTFAVKSLHVSQIIFLGRIRRRTIFEAEHVPTSKNFDVFCQLALRKCGGFYSFQS